MSVKLTISVGGVLNLPSTNVGGLNVTNIDGGLVTSSAGVLSSIPNIDTINLSEELQTRLTNIETDITSLQNNGTSDLSLNNINVNGVTINGLASGFVKSTTGVLSSSSIEINDINGLQTKLSNVDASINALSGNNNAVDDSAYITLDDTVNLVQSFDTINIQNFANNWYQLNNSPTDNGVGLAASYNGQYVLKLGWGASCYLSKDFGNSWTVVSALGSYQWAASMSSGGQYILSTTIVGSSQISNDYGASWNYISSVGTPNDGKVSPTGKYVVLASNSGIYYSSNYGESFTNWTDSGTNSWNSVSISSDGSSAVAIRGTTPTTIWKTTNYGTTWQQIYNNPSNISFGSIACSSDCKYVLVALSQGTNGYMYLSSNYGTTFSSISDGSGLSSSYYFRVSVSSNGMYMVSACNGGNVYYSINYGATWSQTPLASTNYYGICMSENANIIYAYAPGARVRCFNSNITSISTVAMNNPGKGSIYFDETTNKLYIYNSNSSAWKSVTLA